MNLILIIIFSIIGAFTVGVVLGNLCKLLLNKIITKKVHK